MYYLYVMKIRIAAEIEKAGYKQYNRGEQSRTVSVSDGGAIMHIESVFPGAYWSLLMQPNKTQVQSPGKCR